MFGRKDVGWYGRIVQIVMVENASPESHGGDSSSKKNSHGAFSFVEVASPKISHGAFSFVKVASPKTVMVHLAGPDGRK
jgi:hypothetical protein